MTARPNKSSVGSTEVRENASHHTAKNIGGSDSCARVACFSSM